MLSRVISGYASLGEVSQVSKVKARLGHVRSGYTRLEQIRPG
jgi:hypothetical protein